jgi:hypothetical protein
MVPDATKRTSCFAARRKRPALFTIIFIASRALLSGAVCENSAHTTSGE